ncbi:MAG: hypothetical protein CMP65_03540 [Flavobacteriales bacterium]|nr:hypothetical protein [Flavobacteriales bacterium]|tara:strand:+ start:18435 stop:19292 length:858 start_codon:yes stop_codon:yes gene_type:complete
MKNLVILAILTLYLGCDKIDPPYQIDPEINTSEKKILVEKFTGHKCSKCPKAGRLLDEIKSIYPQIISVAIHPGSSGLTNIDDNHPYDFTTNSGNEIADYVGLPSFIPLGTINRKNGGINNTKVFSPSDWEEEISNTLNINNEPALPKVAINIENEYDAITKVLTIETRISQLDTLNSQYKLCLFIMESGIISPQKDDEAENGNTIEFQHDNIYRSAVNGTFGEDISLEKDLSTKTQHTITFNELNNMNWTDSWNNIENCDIVAYVYDKNSGEIQQVQKKSIIGE